MYLGEYFIESQRMNRKINIEKWKLTYNKIIVQIRRKKKITQRKEQTFKNFKEDWSKNLQGQNKKEQKKRNKKLFLCLKIKGLQTNFLKLQPEKKKKKKKKKKTFTRVKEK